MAGRLGYELSHSLLSFIANFSGHMPNGCTGRAVNAELLITEPNNPFATMLMSINIDEPADFGPEVTRLAKNITEKPGQLYTREGLRELYKDAPDSLVRGATNLMR